jgi:hypothetical protein
VAFYSMGSWGPWGPLLLLILLGLADGENFFVKRTEMFSSVQFCYLRRIQIKCSIFANTDFLRHTSNDV